MCLRGIPEDELQNIRQQLKGSSGNPAEKRHFEQLIRDECASVTVDRSGRIQLPREMMAAAGIVKNAMLVGLLDRFEIWSLDLFNTLGLFE